MRKEREFIEERKLVEFGHMKRTLSLMKINEELNREINEIKRRLICQRRKLRSFPILENSECLIGLQCGSG